MTAEQSGEPVEFVVSYEGPSLDDHTMPVRDLAPALMALGDAFDRANALVNGQRTDVTLDVRAANPGSFELALILHQAVHPAVNMMLSGDFVTTASALKGLLFGSTGLFSLLKGLRGQQPEVQLLADGIRVRATNFEMVVPTEVYRMHQDQPLREQVRVVLQPVLRSGVERLLIKEGGETVQHVERNEVTYFGAAAPDGDATQAASEVVFPRQRLVLNSVTFDSGKWRMNDGERNHYYSIKDEVFRQEVLDGRRLFGHGDMLDCEVAITQIQDADGRPRMDYEVRRVLDHVRKPPAPLPPPGLFDAAP